MNNTEPKKIDVLELAKLYKKRDEERAKLAITVTEKPINDVEKVGYQMRFWPENAAAMPTELTRVSLFGLPADKPGARKFLEDVKLDSRSDVEILYTGKLLNAKDETAWLACLRIGRGIPMGERIHMSILDVLKECNLTDTGVNRKRMLERLKRLSKSHFEIKFKRANESYELHTGLLGWGIEHESGAMYIRLDPEGAKLFENLSYQPWEVRLSLSSDVAARVLSYVSGHAQGKPHAQTLENLKNWCGYEGVIRKFRVACQHALNELENKGILVNGSVKFNNGAHGEVVSWVRKKTAQTPATEEQQPEPQ